MPATPVPASPSTGAVYDVAIVGGGPVGLAAAIAARLRGLSVVMVEKRGGDIDKACGEGLMPGALPLLRRLGVEPDGHPLRGVSYRGAARGSVGVTHRFDGAGGLGVRRTTLHRALAERAHGLGVTRIAGRADAVRTATTAGGPIAGVHVSAPARGPAAGGPGSPDIPSDGWISARYLLGCDGLHSTVARMAGLDAGRDGGAAARLGRPGRRHRPRRYGVRQHYALAPWSDNIEVYYGPFAEFYVTPVSASEVGIAMLASQGGDFDAELATVPDLVDRLGDAPAASTRRGAGPFGRTTRARRRGPVLLVGDASGYVDALTGEGLRLGIAQAFLAIDCIAAGQPGRYGRAWARETRRFRVLTTGLVLLATSPARRFIVPAAARLPRVFGYIVERLAR